MNQAHPDGYTEAKQWIDSLGEKYGLSSAKQKTAYYYARKSLLHADDILPKTAARMGMKGAKNE